MRILCTVTTDLTYDQRMQRICTALAGAGHEVTLIGRQLPHSIPLGEQPYRQRRLRCYYHRGALFYAEYNLRLLWLLLTTRYDAINAIDLDTLLPATVAGRLRGRAVVYDAHEYFTEVPEVHDRPRIKRVWEAIARFCVPRVKAAYTVGPALAEIFERQYGVPFKVVRNVPFRRPLSEAALHQPPVLLYQGALNVGRGLPELIDALPQLPGLQLWLAGEGDLSLPLRRQVARLGVTRVRFLGFVQPADLPALTAQATIGLNLLEHRGQSYFYSLANKFFDYAQAGLPSLNMAFPEYNRLVDDYETAVLLHDLSPSAIVNAVHRLLERDANGSWVPTAFYRRLQANCAQAAAVWHWGRERERLLEVYRELE